MFSSILYEHPKDKSCTSGIIPQIIIYSEWPLWTHPLPECHEARGVLPLPATRYALPPPLTLISFCRGRHFPLCLSAYSPIFLRVLGRPFCWPVACPISIVNVDDVINIVNSNVNGCENNGNDIMKNHDRIVMRMK